MTGGRPGKRGEYQGRGNARESLRHHGHHRGNGPSCCCGDVAPVPCFFLALVLMVVAYLVLIELGKYAIEPKDPRHRDLGP